MVVPCCSRATSATYLSLFHSCYQPLPRPALPPRETDGQTSSGKTHTVTGSAKDPGMMVLAVQEVFDRISKAGANTLFLVRVSYLEIYNESIRDLL